jgi:hypothetical protein
MPSIRPSFAALVAVALVTTIAASGSAEPLFTLADDGRTFLYHARPGDHPGVVAEMFGIPQRDIPAFLAANGITDPTRVGAGFTYRVPNAAAHALAERVGTLEQENGRLGHSLAAEKDRTQALERSAADARTTASAAEARADRLAGLDRLWPWAKLAIVLLAVAFGGAAYTAFLALRRQTQADRYARTLAQELEEKRRAVLGERQESAKRILDLETRLRTLEAKLAPRVVIGGRGNG